jgi:hypothetical protein
MNHLITANPPTVVRGGDIFYVRQKDLWPTLERSIMTPNEQYTPLNSTLLRLNMHKA